MNLAVAYNQKLMLNIWNWEMVWKRTLIYI